MFLKPKIVRFSQILSRKINTRISSLKLFTTLSAVIACVGLSPSSIALESTPLPLVGNQVVTLIDVPNAKSRATEAVLAGFGEQVVNIEATTQTWSGSGLRNGKYIGYIDHYSLDRPKNNYVYSAPYASLSLHIASKTNKAKDITRLDKIYRQRLGIENRFANTDALRGERSVSWARSPSFFTNIQQLAGRRVDYIIADKYMLDEFNKLLKANGKDLLYLSSTPIYTVDMSLAINLNQPNASALIEEFNAGINKLKGSGELSTILDSPKEETSLLDPALYSDIVRRW